MRTATVRRALLAALAAACLTVVLLPVGANPSGADAQTGAAGTDTSLADTDSPVTVTAPAPFAPLTIHVNQTRNLINQAVSVTWRGGEPTSPGEFRSDYLQMFQCWGDDDGTRPDDPGPPREQCQFGGQILNGKGSGPVGFASGSYSPTRILSRSDLAGYDASQGYTDAGGVLWSPFRAPDGTEVKTSTVAADTPSGGRYNNQYFNYATSNEIIGARTGSNGTGSELFEVQTGLEATGLGCGQKVQVLADGSTKVPRCWLVVVPRGSAAYENQGFGTDDPNAPVLTSPMYETAWRSRISIPLDFNPVDSSCPLSDQQRRIVGSELATAAVTSWQPVLCSRPGLPPYSYASISDDLARQQVASPVTGGPGMAVVSKPLSDSQVDPSDPAVYAPITLSSIVIGFNVERSPASRSPDDERALAGLRVATIDLTPRIVAKLLSQSYTAAFPSPTGYEWAERNPTSFVSDPDFLQFNPEFRLLTEGPVTRALAAFVLAQPRSDAAEQVWRYLLADPEAQAFLQGYPDPWGMRVNPYYATDATRNPSGVAFADPVPDQYPKNDPFCAPPVNKISNGQRAPGVCVLDRQPYTLGMKDAAQATRSTNDGAKTTFDPLAVTPSAAYVSDGPQAIGQKGVLSITDSASAVRYGLQTARISRAGDDVDARTFIAPDAAGMQAAAAALVPTTDHAVLHVDGAATPAGAYPLTALTYAVAFPQDLDAAGRKEYGAFVRYAAGDGQVPGLALGQLPLGYVPLTAPLKASALAAATTIENPPVAAAPGVDPTGTTAGAGGGGGATPGLVPGSRSAGGPGSAVGVGGSPAPSIPPSHTAAAAPPAGATSPGPPSSGLLPLVRTLRDAMSSGRLVVPFVLAVAVAAGLASFLIGVGRRHRGVRATWRSAPTTEPDISDDGV